LNGASFEQEVFEYNQKAMKWLILGGSFVTLVLWTNLNDPINVPKSWILCIAGFWLLGWVISQVKYRWQNSCLRWAIILGCCFWIALVASFVATDNKFIGMFGDYQRRTGLLSYSCLIVFFLAASFLINLKSLKSLHLATVFVGFLVGIYGFAQHFKYDLIQWNNPYNSVLSTLGNPDFAAAFMGIFAVLNFGLLIQSKYVRWLRLLSGANVLLLLTVIIFSQVRQGLLIAAAGITSIAIVWTFQKSNKSGYAISALGLIVALLSLIGMLNKGPIAKYIYKVSITYRGDYWRAGWRMLINHPFFGVGLDRYGAYFREYRDTTQALRRGPDLVSNAAHSVPIQLASTGGIFVLLTFIALTGFILWRGVIALRTSEGSNQITVATIFAAWLAYEAQSFISIDNLAVAVWGYILGGAVVGISLIPNLPNNKQVKASILQPLFSSILALSVFAISALFLQAEMAMRSSSSLPLPQSSSQIKEFEVAAKKPLSYVFQEPAFSIKVAASLAQAQDFQAAEEILQRTIKSDPRAFDAMETQARIYEYQQRWSKAVQLRQKMITLDPFNSNLKAQLLQDQRSETAKAK
jgi:tetratricopeptide (TPR) repeat protein